jgi:4a-hydroxytetrahydrobiopterin dehydratase
MKHSENWQRIELENKQSCLKRDFVFNNFIEAFAFLTRVAMVSEKINHHPSIFNTYNKVSLQLNTHDAKNTITELDINLSKEIDKLL